MCVGEDGGEGLTEGNEEVRRKVMDVTSSDGENKGGEEEG